MPREYTGPRWRDVRDEVLDRKAKGERRDDIADALGVNRGTLRQWCSHAGVRFSSRGRLAVRAPLLVSPSVAKAMLAADVAAGRAEIEAAVGSAA